MEDSSLSRQLNVQETDGFNVTLPCIARYAKPKTSERTRF